MSNPTESIPLYLQRKLAHKCTRCGAPAAKDAGLCLTHLEQARASDRKWRKAKRQKLKKKGLCIDCGKRSKTLRCRRCYRKSRYEQPGVDTAPEGVDKWRPDFDPVTGAEWARYRGKGRRGRLTREEQLDELKRDMLFAIEKAKDCVRSIETLKSPEIQQLPSIQRGAAYREVADLAGQSSRLAESVEDALKGDT